MPQDRPDGPIHLVTGGTGLLGSHIAERLVARGDLVRALVRPTSDARGSCAASGSNSSKGDLTDAASYARAMEGVAVVYHSAAKVGDWGPWHEFQTGCLDATETLARGRGEGGCRAVPPHQLDERPTAIPGREGRRSTNRAPLGRNLWPIWDYYTRSKVDCEHILWGLADLEGLRLSVIRPSWLYGERDRTTTARIVRRTRAGKVPMIGRGDNPLSAIYAGNVADAAVLAADDPGSVGEAYNVTSMGPITQREFFNLFANASEASATSSEGALRPDVRGRHRDRGGLSPHAPPPAARHHPIRHLAHGPRPRVQHRQGGNKARLAARRRLP